MAHFLYVRAGRLSAISDLARTVHPGFVAELLHCGHDREFGISFRFLQHYLWRFALEGRTGNGRFAATLVGVGTCPLDRDHDWYDCAPRKNSCWQIQSPSV